MTDPRDPATSPAPPAAPAGRVVVGMDLTPLSRAAAREAARVAAVLHAPLEVVCVYRDELDRHWTWPALDSEEEVRKHTEEVVQDALAACGGRPVEVTISIVEGRPASALLARARGARLLVVGGRRGTGIEHMMLGSVARHCVEHSQSPVLVVPEEPARRSDKQPGASAGRIVVGVDGSPSSVEALRWAEMLSSEYGSGIDAVAVWTPPVYTTGFGYAAVPEVWDGRDVAERSVQHAVSDVFGCAPPASLRKIVDEGYAGHRLLERSEGAALLIVGNRGRGALAALLGSVSFKCVHHAGCPVLVVHHPVATDNASDRPSD